MDTSHAAERAIQAELLKWWDDLPFMSRDALAARIADALNRDGLLRDTAEPKDIAPNVTAEMVEAGVEVIYGVEPFCSRPASLDEWREAVTCIFKRMTSVKP